MRSEEDEDICRVCGYSDGGLFYEDTWATNAICPCCGAESGIQALSLQGAREYRGYWIGQGARWFRQKEQPPGWDLVKQLTKIPREWR
ncbi:hypothetical protein [Streptomyces sp. NPDC086787]|uniref:hypothetical protein n=1 Tax=Streptomyces sp. NPDC086787 TaxID=3365759 RepID=UPI0037F7D2D4